MDGTLVILGCGYIGARVARSALAEGRSVRVCARSTARLEPLRALGAEVHALDATKVRQFGPALHGTVSPAVLYAVPPLPEMPSGVSLARACEAAMNVGARSFIYLSSAGLYGDKPNDDWIDESSNVAHDDPAMASYFTDEAAVESAGFGGLRTIILRLAAVYGPGRGVRARLRAGDYKLLDDGRYWVSRIHVDDLVRIVFAAEARAPQGARYLVADDRPTTQREYAEWLSKRLGVPLPASVSSYAPGARRTAHRGRRIHNDALKRDLDLTLLYPSFVEGDEAVEREEQGDAPAAAPPPASGPRPDFVKNVAALPWQTWTYPGSTESLGEWQELGDAVGLAQVGVSIMRLPPGCRSSWPHAHSTDDELMYILEGTPDVWLDGELVRLGPGDVVGFKAGTGIGHTTINNTTKDVKFLAVGSRLSGDRVIYPKHPERQASLEPGRAWSDAPPRTLGAHDGLPEAKRR
jgi:uncharacterized cupin superfamily protein/nucleoside-diphosphate-sugar epimerase